MGMSKVPRKILDSYEKFAKEFGDDPNTDIMVKPNVLLALIHEVKVARFKSSTKFKNHYMEGKANGAR